MLRWRDLGAVSSKQLAAEQAPHPSAGPAQAAVD
jgi:hypothetical protein